MPRGNLLLVDGDPTSLGVVEISLRSAGFSVATAANTADALQKMQQTRPDLIISETSLPGEDGFAFCARLKADPSWARTPFIFLSGDRGLEEKMRGLRAGAEDFLEKPIYTREIISRIRTWFHKREKEALGQGICHSRCSGSLKRVGVVDLVQALAQGSKSGIVTLYSADVPPRKGRMFIHEG